MSTSTGTSPIDSRTRIVVLVIASIGFLFDTYELLMTPLVAVPAIAELLGLPPNNPVVTDWTGRMLWISALCGGTFGLMGGWLIDRFGRKRIMAASIFLYAFSPFAAAFSTNLTSFVLFRSLTFVGVCIEFVAAITWLAELFDDPKQREFALGFTQAFASLGGLLVTAFNGWIVMHASDLAALPIPDVFNAHASWRYTLMTGILPALPIAILLPFAPESRVWLERRASNSLARPSLSGLFAPELRRTTLVTAALSACAYAAAFGALQLTPLRIIPGVPELAGERATLKPLQEEAKMINAGILELDPAVKSAFDAVPGLRELVAKRARNRVAFRAAVKADDKPLIARLSAEFKALGDTMEQITGAVPEAKKSVLDREKLLKQLGDNREKQEGADKAIKARGNDAQFWQEMGGLAGRILLAALVLFAVSRRRLLRIFLVPGLLALPLTYFSFYHSGGAGLNWAIGICGLLVVAQFSYFGEFLPKVFPVHLRGTGGSFATNVGGRMIGTSAAFLTTNILAPLMPGVSTYDKVALAAGIVGTTVFVIALGLSFFLPEAPSANPSVPA
ncbi:MAG: MFS transporter [Verrucomicrobia bacterium]|nr:MFS transporter [Verrucomicrobiota bacterium]